MFVFATRHPACSNATVLILLAGETVGARGDKTQLSKWRITELKQCCGSAYT